MPTISLRTSVPLNGSSGNVLAGSPFEFVAKDSIIVLMITQAGGTPGEITADFQIGGESLSQAGNVSTRAGFPNSETDIFVKAGAVGGERLFLNYNNTTAAPLDVDTFIDIVPI